MYPYIHIGKYLLESYTLFINLGTLSGSFAMYFILEKYCKEEKYRWKIIVILLAIMGISAPFARYIKSIFYNGNGTATHFLGRVLATLVLMEFVFAFIWKNKSCVGQARNAVVAYLGIQHLFNRISCLLNGCCGGKIIRRWNRAFPSQLFEMICMVVVIMIICMYIYKRKNFYFQFYIYFSIVIFISEFFIADTRINEYKISPLTGIQVGAILMWVIAVICYIGEKVKKRDTKPFSVFD